MKLSEIYLREAEYSSDISNARSKKALDSFSASNPNKASELGLDDEKRKNMLIQVFGRMFDNQNKNYPKGEPISKFESEEPELYATMLKKMGPDWKPYKEYEVWKNSDGWIITQDPTNHGIVSPLYLDPKTNEWLTDDDLDTSTSDNLLNSIGFE